ncbi:DUF1289 domain-containing protein [Coxiella endosymbiont of Ornithodoros maritimus]|uniref:DUF1289 domain-containing protein n=1 Tax=Coxiella endosymbiont of Ornithodoros maritimus TaxID=1656172 RepID=UPI002263AFD5|nr:DUF1289 domain-containing protein [Coxiella endosymbiont of Ornithodoros maritimus]
MQATLAFVWWKSSRYIKISPMNIAGKRNLTDSPCIGICSATALGDAVCIGCGRTFDEVCRWNTLSEEEKIAINHRLAEKNNQI